MGKITWMNPLIRDAPDSLHCEADLHSVRIRFRRPWSMASVLSVALLVVFNVLLVGLAFSASDPLVVLLGVGLVGGLDLLWLWGVTRRQTMRVEIDAHTLHVAVTGLGASYRIPLIDITTVRLLDATSTSCRLSITLTDDVIAIGHRHSRHELAWLAPVVRRAAAQARQRPVHRTGMPDDVPAALAAMQSTRE